MYIKPVHYFIAQLLNPHIRNSSDKLHEQGDLAIYHTPHTNTHTHTLQWGEG